ncbi:MAG: hypothetical protein ABIO70_08905 [Pseudomonadota bacterium]
MRDFPFLLLLTACTQDLSERLAATHLEWAVADDHYALFAWANDDLLLDLIAVDRIEASCSELNPQQVSFLVTDPETRSAENELEAWLDLWELGRGPDTGLHGRGRRFAGTTGTVTLTRVEPCTSDGLGTLDVALANIVLERDGPGQRTVEAFTWTTVPVARMSHYDGE